MSECYETPIPLCLNGGEYYFSAASLGFNPESHGGNVIGTQRGDQYPERVEQGLRLCVLSTIWICLIQGNFASSLFI